MVFSSARVFTVLETNPVKFMLFACITLNLQYILFRFRICVSRLKKDHKCGLSNWLLHDQNLCPGKVTFLNFFKDRVSLWYTRLTLKS
jgi:hypothetical protein